MYPTLFEFGSLFVSTQWTLVAIGLLVSGIILVQLMERTSMKIAFMVTHFITMLIIGVVAGRIMYLILNIPDLRQLSFIDLPLRIIAVWDRGIDIWGFIIGIFGYIAYAARRDEESVGKWFDIMTIAALAGLFFGHFGTLFEGDAYGRPTKLPWGITFDSMNVPYTVPVHPTQIYAAAYTLITCGVLLWALLKHKTKQPGDITYIAIIAYSGMRFVEEFFRGDEAYLFMGLHLAHWIALIAFLTSGILLLLRYNKLAFITKHFS